MEQQKKDLQQQALFKCSLTDAVMDKETVVAANEYISTAGTPFNVLRALVDGYKGYSAITNQMAVDFSSCFQQDARPMLLKAIKETLIKLVEDEKASLLLDSIVSIDSDLNKNSGGSIKNQNANSEIEDDEQQIISKLIENKGFREIICELSEQFPKSELLSKLSTDVSQKGYQSEVATISGAASYPDLFFEMLSTAIQGIKSADDGNINTQIEDLWQLVGYREHTYFLAQYMLQEAHKRSGECSYAFQRVIEELEGRVYKQFERPLVATHLQILLEGLPIDGKDPISLALVSMLQSGRAAPGDVVALYKAYHDSPNPPPTKVIRNTDITELLLKEVFTFYNDDEDKGALQESLVDKYLWLISYSARTVDNITNPAEKMELENSREELVQTLKQMTQKLGSINLMTDLNKMMSWILEIIRIPIAALLTTEWLRSVLIANDYNFLVTYYRQGEVPMPMLILEEIAFLQPQLRPQVFSVYIEIFMCRIEDFLPEVRIAFQQVVLGLMTNLVQMGYGLAVTRYILDQLQQRTIDESLVVLYISKVLEMLAPPFVSELLMLLLQLMVRVVSALIDNTGMHSNIVYFLKCVTSSSEKYTSGEVDVAAVEASLLLLQVFENHLA